VIWNRLIVRYFGALFYYFTSSRSPHLVDPWQIEIRNDDRNWNEPSPPFPPCQRRVCICYTSVEPVLIIRFCSFANPSDGYLTHQHPARSVPVVSKKAQAQRRPMNPPTRRPVFLVKISSSVRAKVCKTKNVADLYDASLGRCAVASLTITHNRNQPRTIISPENGHLAC
jgi:hypothetical protein